MGKPLTMEARLQGTATLQAQADAFARKMADTIRALEREGGAEDGRLGSQGQLRLRLRDPNDAPARRAPDRGAAAA